MNTFEFEIEFNNLPENQLEVAENMTRKLCAEYCGGFIDTEPLIQLAKKLHENLNKATENIININE